MVVVFITWDVYTAALMCCPVVHYCCAVIIHLCWCSSFLSVDQTERCKGLRRMLCTDSKYESTAVRLSHV